MTDDLDLPGSPIPEGPEEPTTDPIVEPAETDPADYRGEPTEEPE